MGEPVSMALRILLARSPSLTRSPYVRPEGRK